MILQGASAANVRSIKILDINDYPECRTLLLIFLDTLYSHDVNIVWILDCCSRTL